MGVMLTEPEMSLPSGDTASPPADDDASVPDDAADGHPPALPDRPAHLHTDGCGKKLDAWGVTRQFDFGQFVLLYHNERVNDANANVPVRLLPEGTLFRIVAEGEDQPQTGPDGAAVASVVTPTKVVRSAPGSFIDGRPPENSLAGVAGGVPLDLALRHSHPLELLVGPLLDVDIGNLEDIGRNTPIDSGGLDLFPLLDSSAKAALLQGLMVDALAEGITPDGRTLTVAVRLHPPSESVDLDEDAIDDALATGIVTLSDGTDLLLDRDAATYVALRTGIPLSRTIRNPAGKMRRVTLRPSKLASSKPLATTFTIEDPSAFLRNPQLPAVDGVPLAVNLTRQIIRDLRTNRAATFNLNGVAVTLEVAQPGQPGRWRQPALMVFDPAADLGTAAELLSTNAPPTGRRYVTMRTLDENTAPGLSVGDFDTRWGPVGLTPVPDGGEWKPPKLGWPGKDPFSKIHLDIRYLEWLTFLDRFMRPGENHLPDSRRSTPVPAKGLQVAVLLPWRQQWRFKGLSRGNLLSSIALAPLEERTIRMFSWEHRAKALEQITETETEMQQDYTSTTRDTEDVMRELTSNHNFNLQVHGEFDISYSPGLASIHLGGQVDLAQERNLQEVARTTTQHMTETVHRASARVRSRRITKITESRESVSGEDVVRRIRNPNECRTLTLDYYEQLAHYSINTTFRKEHVRIVALVNNPLGDTPFTNLTVRTNETALRQALLNPELGDGFAAARLLTSYENAWVEAKHIAEESKKVAELDRERVEDEDSPIQPPKNPYKDVVLSAVGDVKKAAKDIYDSQIGPALRTIMRWLLAGGDRVTAVEVYDAQRWLWLKLAESKASPNIREALRTILAITNPGIEDALRVAELIPAPQLQQLAHLAELPDTEKEDRALREAILDELGFWGGVAADAIRKEGLYKPNDNGLVAALTRMQEALHHYDAKESEGGSLLAHQELVNKANQQQEQANWVDKLEMKYGLDVVADAQERQQALLQHLEDHAHYYRYVLFQALPPAEQLSLLIKAAPDLRVGYFEPRVVAYNENQLAIPVTPLAESKLEKLVADLSATLSQTADQAQQAADRMAPDDVILPTPGVVVQTSLGDCCACEPHRRKMHKIARNKARAEADRAQAEARKAAAEAGRRNLRLAGNQLEEFTTDQSGLRLTISVDDARAGDGGADDRGGDLTSEPSDTGFAGGWDDGGSNDRGEIPEFRPQ